MKEKLEQVEKIARLHLSKEEREEFAPQLEAVLKLFDQIKNVNTDREDLVVQPISLENVWREDKARVSLAKQDIFSNTKNKERDFFKGPRIK